MKTLHLSDDTKLNLISEFAKFLETLEATDTNTVFKINTDLTVKEKAKILFTPEAWLKMKKLVKNTSSEIGWYGLTERNEKTFKITDILVYPQEVSGATVTTDETEHLNWLYSLEDEVFNKIRMQGHSHVNMGVTPSGVDTKLYDDTVAQLPENDFYIFIILNKTNQIFIEIYDKAENVIYETKDVEIDILFESNMTSTEWNKDVKQVVKEKKYVYTPPVTLVNQTVYTPHTEPTKTTYPINKNNKNNKYNKKKNNKKEKQEYEEFFREQDRLETLLTKLNKGLRV